jgi:hypothetical protein
VGLEVTGGVGRQRDRALDLVGALREDQLARFRALAQKLEKA